MNAEQLFSRPPSPVSHGLSCILHRSRSAVNRPFSTFQRSNFQTFKRPCVPTFQPYALPTSLR
jgi:hypothetical protein